MVWIFNIMTYNGITIDDNFIVPKDAIGFTYNIYVDVSPKIPMEYWSKNYIGKKHLFSTITVKLPKKTIALQTGKGRKKLSEKITKESNWKNYYGSSKLLKHLSTLDKSALKRTILSFYNSKKELSYREEELLFKHNVLLNDNFLNDNIAGKYFKKDLI